MSGSVHRNRSSSIGNPSARVNRAPPVTETRSCSAQPPRNFAPGHQFCGLLEMKYPREIANESPGWPLGPLAGRVFQRHAGNDQHTWLLEPSQVCARLIKGQLSSVEK